MQHLQENLNLIKSGHIFLFSSWINNKQGSSFYNKMNIPYEFKLLYRSSRDGFNTNSFHKNCDGKGATIWVAKIQGYNPLEWLILQIEKYFYRKIKLRRHYLIFSHMNIQVCFASIMCHPCYKFLLILIKNFKIFFTYCCFQFFKKTEKTHIFV